MSKKILLIFIKNPRLGHVKTRLARTVGDAEALRVYHFLLEKTRAAALRSTARRMLFYSDAVEENDAWASSFFEKKVQHGTDLGERMDNAFRAAFSAGAEKAVIIGSDCPELDEAVLNHAFDALDAADFAIGPVPDGGYYLIGMKNPEPSLFYGIEWSTETVRARTLEKIRALGKTVVLLPELSDVDTEEDWAGYLEREKH
jgi:uncharacterized protein